MLMRQITALTLAIVLACFAGPLAFAQQPAPGQIAGTAKDEVKGSYTDYAVRARSVASGAVAATVKLEPDSKFVLPKLATEQYLVELIYAKNGKVVCTEGPIALTTAKPVKNDVQISCGVPAALWLLAAAAGAGITAAVVIRQPASAGQ